MVQDNGTSAAQTGPSQAEPEVSALRASVPSASDAFRAELVKIMPGYKWTVHRANKGALRLYATGTQSSGFNRLSTLRVERSIERDRPWYKVKSAGYGTRSPFLIEIGDLTLARALRGLQSHYECTSNSYRKLASDLQKGRGLTRAIAKATGQ